MTVADYFQNAFPGHNVAEGEMAILAEMPLDSNCGDECRQAIDVALDAFNTLRDVRNRNDLVTMAVAQCCVYIRG